MPIEKRASNSFLQNDKKSTNIILLHRYKILWRCNLPHCHNYHISDINTILTITKFCQICKGCTSLLYAFLAQCIKCSVCDHPPVHVCSPKADYTLQNFNDFVFEIFLKNLSDFNFGQN